MVELTLYLENDSSEEKIKKKFKNCVHGKNKQICKECGGSAYCEHNKLKQQCKECGSSAYCEHGN